jgi:fructuronate reductase
VDRLAVGVAAWMQFVRRQSLAGAAITDPIAAELAIVGRSCNGVATHDVAAFLALRPIFAPQIAEQSPLRSAWEIAYRRLGSEEPRTAFGV